MKAKDLADIDTTTKKELPYRTWANKLRIKCGISKKEGLERDKTLSRLKVTSDTTLVWMEEKITDGTYSDKKRLIDWVRSG